MLVGIYVRPAVRIMIVGEVNKHLADAAQGKCAIRISWVGIGGTAGRPAEEE